MNTILLEIVTPEKLAFSEDVDQVSVPSTDGELTILPNHIPLFASLQEGEVKINQKGNIFYLAIGGGFIEVTPKKTSILVSRAFRAEELNEQAILSAKKQAEEMLKRKSTAGEMQAAQSLLRSTLIDLKVLKRRSRLKM